MKLLYKRFSIILFYRGFMYEDFRLITEWDLWAMVIGIGNMCYKEFRLGTIRKDSYKHRDRNDLSQVR